MSSSREVRKFVYNAMRRGVDIRHRDGSGHWSVYYQDRRVGSIPYSPSDIRWRREAISMIKRVTGVDLRTSSRKQNRHAEPNPSPGPGSPHPD